MNRVLESEKLSIVTESKFKRLVSDYEYYITKTSSELDLKSTDVIYGVYGKAAQWGDMLGGAEQIVPPLNGTIMKELGIMKEVLR